MDGIAQPFRKVHVIYPTLLFWVHVSHQLFQVIEIEILLISKVFEDVFHCYIAIIVLI